MSPESQSCFFLHGKGRPGERTHESGGKKKEKVGGGELVSYSTASGSTSKKKKKKTREEKNIGILEKKKQPGECVIWWGVLRSTWELCGKRGRKERKKKVKFLRERIARKGSYASSGERPSWKK